LRIFNTQPAFDDSTPPLGSARPNSEYCHSLIFGRKKSRKELWIYHIAKKLENMFTHYTNVRDGRSRTDTTRRHRPRYAQRRAAKADDIIFSHLPGIRNSDLAASTGHLWHVIHYVRMILAHRRLCEQPSESGWDEVVKLWLALSQQLVVASGRRHLRSSDANTRVIQRTRTRLGDCSFAVAGPRLWNSLPVRLRHLNLSIGQFRSALKTHLLKLSRALSDL